MLQLINQASNEFFDELPIMLLRASTSMMSDENEVKPKFSVYDMYDVHDLVHECIISC